MIRPEDARAARDGIADTVESIDRGDLAASAEQRAFLAGAVEVLDAVAADGAKSKD